MSTISAGAPAATAPLVHGEKPSATQLAEWVTRFHRDGYVHILQVLPPALCAELRADFDRVNPTSDQPIEHATRMFEHSQANLDLFECEPIVSLAEALLGEDHVGIETCHVVHNNSFRTRNGGAWSNWHQDDSAHFLCTDDNPPTNIHLPVLLLTANYYLTDQPTAEHGPGQVIPGSHRFGKVPPADLSGTRWEPLITSCTGNVGSVMVFNSQVWHRGAPNHSDRVRYVTQVSYGRRSITHFFHQFMNYQMPQHCLAWADTPRRKRLLGFMPAGAYG